MLSEVRLVGEVFMFVQHIQEDRQYLLQAAGSTVVTTLASQRDGPGFNPQINRGTIRTTYGVCVLSRC